MRSNPVVRPALGIPGIPSILSLALAWLAWLMVPLVHAALPANRDTTFQTLPMDGLPAASFVLGDGKILLGGNFRTINFQIQPAIARLNADGTLDDTFTTSLAPGSANDKQIVTEMVMLPNGGFIATGLLRSTGAVLRTNIIRFNADGTVDPSFDAKSVSPYKGLAVQADGRVLLVGVGGGIAGIKLVRLNQDGSLDGTFNYTKGAYTGLIPLQFQAQTDGHVLAFAGDNNPSSGGIAHLFWLNSDGSQDTSFKFPFPPNQLQDESRFVAGPDGRLLVAGVNAGAQTYTTLQLASDGTVDPAYAFSGDPNNQGVRPIPAAFLPDGGAVLVRNPSSADRRVTFLFLTAAGKLAGQRDLTGAASDTGVVGIGTLPARAFSMQPDGKLLFAEAFLNSGQNTFGMFRLMPPPVAAPPVITQQPVGATIGAGEGLFLGVTATSESPLVYQWQHAGTNLPTQKAASLSVGSNSNERAGDFLVVVGNTFGSVTSQVATIVVRPPTPLVITQQPVGGSVLLSKVFQLSAQCTTDVPLGFQWYKNSLKLVSGAGQGGFAAVNLPANDTTRTADYFVVFTNQFGGAITSSVVHLDLILPGPPTLTSQPQDEALFAGQPVQLAVTAVADGVLSYRWQHEGTNLLVSATILNVTGPSLIIPGTDLNRFGNFQVVVSVNPGGNTTSRVASVTQLPSGPPILLGQPASFTADFGANTNVSVGFNGEAPLRIFWQHAGSNVLFFGGAPGVPYPTLDGPATNRYAFAALPNTAGDYRFIATNRFGGVTSELATVTVKPPTPVSIPTDLKSTVTGIGEFNFISLRQGLVVTNLGNQETTHTLAFRVEGGLPPFRGIGLWQLALGVSNRFYVGENTGAGAAAGTWGFAPGGDNYFSLTNFPGAGDISRLEAYEDGRYGIVLGGNNLQYQSGTYRVLGARRPATNTFTLDVLGPNPIAFAWFKNGVQLDFQGIGRTYLSAETVLGAPPVPGGVNQRLQLVIPDLQPADAGTYTANITNLFPNPDKTFGQPPYIVTSVTRSGGAMLSVRGFTETNAPAVVGASEFSPGDPSAVSLLDDGSLFLGVGSTLGLVAPDGRTNWQAAGFPGVLHAVATDGQGGAFLGGQNGDAGDWFLNRVRPATRVIGGKTNFTATNLWALTVAGPSTNFFDTSGIVHGAEVAGLLPSADGVLVAGRFRGQTRFGATHVPFVGGLFYTVGGITLTNAAPGAFDRSWDLYVAKYDLDGTLLWVRGYGGANDDQLAAFTTDGAGNLFLAGSFKGVAKFGDLTIESTRRVDSPTLTTYATDGFIAKLAPDGTPVWLKTFGGPSNGFLADTQMAAAVVDPAGDVYFAATRSQLSATLQPGIAVGSRYLARLNPAGEIQWAQTLATDGAPRLALDADGNVALADAFRVNAFNQPTVLGAASIEYRPAAGTLLAKFTPGGTLLWARALDEKLPFADDARGAITREMAFGPTGELVVVGTLSGGITADHTRTAGQRFDAVELSTADTGTDVFIARLAPAFLPTAPKFVLQPVSVDAQLQDRVTLEARVDGYPVPSFQWRFNGVPIPGATNRLFTLPELARTNHGNYDVVVSNSVQVVTSATAVITPHLRPNMTGWKMIATTASPFGIPSDVGADDAGNSYVLRPGAGEETLLEHFHPDGSFGWTFQDSDVAAHLGYLISPRGLAVAPDGGVFLCGRLLYKPAFQDNRVNNFILRVNPADGSILWMKQVHPVGQSQIDPSVILLLDFDGAGNVRALFSDRTVHRFDASGSELPVVNLAGMAATVDLSKFALALDRDGGIYAFANRIEALNVGLTNFPALGGAIPGGRSPGYESLVLARFSADGTPQWFREYPGSQFTFAYANRVQADAAGNAILAGELGAQPGRPFQFGTNSLTGFGYAVKVSPSGDVVWARSSYLTINDVAVRGDGSVYLAGWFRHDPTLPTADRRVRFGNNVVSAANLRDAFIARYDADGGEDFIRQTGSPDFDTVDNAHGYRLSVSTTGVVTTAGFTEVSPSGGRVDFGDLGLVYPDLRALGYTGGGNPPCLYVARLEAETTPPGPVNVVFTTPDPGSTVLRVEWPAGFRLQFRTSLTDDAIWQTLDLPSPFSVDAALLPEGYFRVVSP